MMVTVLDILVESTATPPSYQVSKYNAEYSRLEFSLLLYQIESEGGRKICKFVCIVSTYQCNYALGGLNFGGQALKGCAFLCLRYFLIVIRSVLRAESIFSTS